MALAYGTAGFMALGGYGFVDALYMTMTTLTTVGFGEIQPLDAGGRVFTMTVIVFGLGSVFAPAGRLDGPRGARPTGRLADEET